MDLTSSSNFKVGDYVVSKGYESYVYQIVEINEDEVKFYVLNKSRDYYGNAKYILNSLKLATNEQISEAVKERLLDL